MVSLLGDPPLVAGESEAAYKELQSRLIKTLLPADPIEDLIVDEIANRAWETARWRRARATFLNAQLPTLLMRILSPLCGAGNGPVDSVALGRLVDAWRQDDPAAVKKLDAMLGSMGLSLATVCDSLPVVDPDVFRFVAEIERQVLIGETRFEAALDGLDRYRRQRRDHSRQRLIETSQQASSQEGEIQENDLGGSGVPTDDERTENTEQSPQCEPKYGA
jgi:hypothetical protein